MTPDSRALCAHCRLEVEAELVARHGASVITISWEPWETEQWCGRCFVSRSGFTKSQQWTHRRRVAGLLSWTVMEGDQDGR